MRLVKKWKCGLCGNEYDSAVEAEACERLCGVEAEKRRKSAEEHKKHLDDNNLAEWVEDGERKTAKRVDAATHGSHKYDDHGTSDCAHGCGCWMGPFRSGGPVDPFGPCPNNPKKQAKKRK